MKKLLLSLGALALVMTASAQSIDNMLDENNSTFENGQKNGWSSWGNGSESAVVEGGYNSEYCLELVNPAEGDDYYVAQAAYTFSTPLENGTEYTLTLWAKSKDEGGAIQVAYQNSTDYSGGGYTAFNLTTEWKQYTKTFTISGDGNDRILISFGKVIGTFYVDDIVFGTEVQDEDGFQTPEGYAVVISGDTADGNKIVEWSNDMENGTKDGKECIVYTNETKGNSYDTQLAIDYNYNPATMYYITFDVMGTVSDVNIGAWFQYKQSYKTIGGYSTFNTFKVTSDSEWTQVVLKGTYDVATEGDEAGLEADRVALNLGEYVGTLYITNIKLYAPTTDGIAAVENADTDRVVVYNLQGIKVLDTDNASAVNELNKGLYIVNGKKVLVK